MSARQPLFLCQNGTHGDVVFSRAVIRAAAASGRYSLAVGCCRDDQELLADLDGPDCRVVVSGFPNTPFGAPVDLGCLNGDGRPGIAIALGGNQDWPSYQWCEMAGSFDSDLHRLGLEPLFGDQGDEVPMLDFAGASAPFAPRRRAIYLDNARTRYEPSHFVFDFERLCDVLPDHDLLCTAPTGFVHEHLVDIAGLSSVQRSAISERCELLVGSTMDPFNLTLTEANRFKPKALCGHDARTECPMWDYPGNPLELLATMDDLVDFLLANVAVEARR